MAEGSAAVSVNQLISQDVLQSQIIGSFPQFFLTGLILLTALLPDSLNCLFFLGSYLLVLLLFICGRWLNQKLLHLRTEASPARLLDGQNLSQGRFILAIIVLSLLWSPFMAPSLHPLADGLILISHFLFMGAGALSALSDYSLSRSLSAGSVWQTLIFPLSSSGHLEKEGQTKRDGAS